jgi:hypothetical protein
MRHDDDDLITNVRKMKRIKLTARLGPFPTLAAQQQVHGRSISDFDRETMNSHTTERHLIK